MLERDLVIVSQHRQRAAGDDLQIRWCSAEALRVHPSELPVPDAEVLPAIR